LPAQLVDTHAHVMDAAFDGDRPAVLARARAAGVEHLVLVGYDLASSRAAVQLAATVPGAAATAGIHPNSAAEHTSADFDALAELARTAGVVAIGETGLDYVREFTPPARQQEAFAWHLALAESLQLPVVVHNRQADAGVAAALVASAARRPTGTVPGVLHCFSSTDPVFLGRLVDAGYYVSFAGPLTFKSATDLRTMARLVPAERLLVETDCPYLAPVPHRGRRNEPAFVAATAACLAEVRQTPWPELGPQLVANSLRLFSGLASTVDNAA
jgi:TatD DNase family protein